MAELPENDPRVRLARANLTQLMMNLRARGPLTSAMIDNMVREVNDLRASFKREHGYDLPPLMPFVLPTSDFIVLYRTDLDNKEIEQKILFLLRDMAKSHRPVSKVELARAIKVVWPHYDPAIEDFEARGSKVKLVN